MRILITLAEPFLPQQAGGSQTTAMEMATAFRRRGQTVAIAASLNRRSLSGLWPAATMKLRGRPYHQGTYAGHRTYRTQHIGRNIARVLDAFRPDVVLLHAMEAMETAHTVSGRGVPLVVFWHDVERHRMKGSPEGLKARYLANSRFTADFYASEFGVSSMVAPPLIQRDRYIASERRPSSVLFIGTVPEKGLEVAIGVAALCPDIPFEFVESWLLPPSQERALRARLAALPNVRFLRRQAAPASLYGRAKILLAPSQWREAWGRVASEAHINGVPVIGSDIGGLPESIGPGGVLVDPQAPASVWAEQVERLWRDEALRARLSAEAETYSRRPELDPERTLDRVLEELRAATASRA